MPKTQKKEPFSVDENIDIGLVPLSESQGVKISLVSKNGEHYISITRMYKTKADNKWNPKSGTWIPFNAANDIMTKVYEAYETGLKLNWGAKKKSTEDKMKDIIQHGIELWP